MILVTLCFGKNVVLADVNVAKIGDEMYDSLDLAILDAKDGDTIELLSDSTSKGFILDKNLTIKSSSKEDKYTISFIENGIGLSNNSSLTFDNVKVLFNGVGVVNSSEWNWMTIVLSKESKLNLVDTIMELDGTGTKSNGKSTHAIYFCGNNTLDLNNSSLTIKNYSEDALEWDGGNYEYKINLVDSTFNSYNNRGGFTGGFAVKAISSNINVIGNTGNGSNGSSFEFIKSEVSFSNNGSHGISASNLIINDSRVTALGNGANGVHVKNNFHVYNSSKLEIMNNDCSISSKWTVPGALYVGGNGLIEEDTTLNIMNNNGSGIYVDSAGNLEVLTGTITGNIADKLLLGGGINNHGKIVIGSLVKIYNNSALTGGDDIYSEGYIDLPLSVMGERLVLAREDERILNDCEHIINGWYDDLPDMRWEAHDIDNIYVELVEAGTYEGVIAIKAAHDNIGNLSVRYVDSDYNDLTEEVISSGVVGSEYDTEEKYFDGYEFAYIIGNKNGKYDFEDSYVIYVYEKIKMGNLIVNYVDSDGNYLTSSIYSSDRVGEEYVTEKKSFDGYQFIMVEGNTSGKYIDGTIVVTYYYDKNTGTGDIEPPSTGVNTGCISVSNVDYVVLYKREED